MEDYWGQGNQETLFRKKRAFWENPGWIKNSTKVKEATATK